MTQDNTREALARLADTAESYLAFSCSELALEQEIDKARTALSSQPPAPQVLPALVSDVVRSVQPHLSEDSKAWRDLTEECSYWLRAIAALQVATAPTKAEGASK